MAGRDMLSQVFVDIAAGIRLLTRLPVPLSLSQGRGAKGAWAWGLAGLPPALLCGFLIIILQWTGATTGFTAALGLTVLIMSTGALHEDGLADTADGFWGGWTRERRLEIMKDSRIGTYGVIALGLSLLARWSLLAGLIGAGPFLAPLIVAALVSRSFMVGVMAWMDPARADGLSRSVGRPEMSAFWISLAISSGAGLALVGLSVLPALLAGLAVSAGMIRLATSKIGGQTGDVLGATQQLTEIAVLAVLAACLT